MKTSILRQITTIAFLITGMIGVQNVQGQTAYQSNATSVTVKGTSTLHDWDMKSTRGQTKATFTIADNQVSGITALSFTVGAETLKSDKSGLDRNAYKALNTDKHKNITFTMTSGTVTSTGANNIRINATGNLVINGTTKSTTLVATGTYNPTDKSITVRGSTKFNMSAHGVKPPVVLMGTIKTGDEITIDYNVKLTP